MDKVDINADLYEKVYDEIKDYGRAKYSHCPGIRLYPHYKDYLKGKIIDLGSGTGETVKFFRKKKFEAYGIDWIKPKNKFCKQGDITLKKDLRRYTVATSFDVMEHLNNSKVKGLFQNMIQCKYQIFTISNDKSIISLKNDTQIDLHINKKPFDVWRGIISNYFQILRELPIRKSQRLYICTNILETHEYNEYMAKFLRKQGYEVNKMKHQSMNEFLIQAFKKVQENEDS